MDHNPEYLLKLGRKQMYIDKNYEAAEKTFLLVYQMEYRKILVEVLLDICRKNKAKHETRGHEIESEGTENNTQRNKECHENEQEKWEGGGSNEERGGGNQNCIKNETKEQVEVKTNSLDNPSVNIHHSGYLLRSKERGEGEMCTRHDLKCNNTNRSKLGCHAGEYQEKNLEQRAMKRHTEHKKESRKEGEKISHLCKKNNIVQLESAKENAEDHGSSQYRSNESKHKKIEDVNKIYENQWDEEDNLAVKKSSKNTPEESNNEVKNDVVIKIESDIQLKERDEKETEMMRMSLTLRAYVIQFGIDVFSQKPNYRPEVNFDSVSRCIDESILRAQKCFLDGNKEGCEYYLSEAENVYSSVAIVLPKASVIKPKRVQNNQNKSNESERNTENFTANIATSYKDFVRGDDFDVTKCLKLAESAILARNFKKAERLIKKSERICPTKNARELLHKLEAAKKEAAVQEATIEAAKQATRANEQTALLKTEQEIDNCFEAKEVLNKTEEIINNETIKKTYDLDETIVLKQKYGTQNLERVTKIVDKQAAEDCIQIAEGALKSTDFTKAERMLLKAKRIDPNINIEKHQTQIRIAIASRSSTAEDLEKDFQPTNDRMQTSKECVKIAHNYLKQKNIPKAEESLLKAKKYYNSNNLKEKYEHIEKIKAEIDSVKIAEPSYVHSNSETCFANDPNQEVLPSYHISKDQDADIVEDYLKDGRSALIEGLLEKAEKYAKKSEQLRTGSATDLLHDIDLVKKMRLDPDFQESILRFGHAWRPPVGSKHSKALRLNADAEQKPSEGKLYDTEDLKPTERAQQLLQPIKKIQNTQYVATQNNMQDLPSGTIENISKIKNDSNLKINMENLIKNAEEAYLAKDLNKAEHLFNQAYDMCPDEKILPFLNKIQKEKIKNQNDINSTKLFTRTIINEKVDSENIEEAKKCVEFAEHACDEGDLDKAERLFTKALRMNPTEHVRNCLKWVKREKESKLIEKTNHEKAEMFVSLAVQAFESGANYNAEKYLQKALRWCYSDDTEQMLVKVQEAIDRKINEKKKKRKNKIQGEKEKEMKIEADKHLKIAKEQLKQGDLENAQFSALISDSFYPSEDSKQLLHRIFDEQWKDEEQVKFIKSEKFIECAKSAIADGDLKLAKQYLILSNALKESVIAKTMIYEVTTAINKVGQNTFSFRKVWEIIKNYIPSFFKN